MGLFGGLERRLRDGRLADGFAAAGAAAAGDYGSMAQINAATRQRQAEAERKRQIDAAITASPGLTEEGKSIARLSPEAFIAMALRQRGDQFWAAPPGSPAPGGQLPAQVGAPTPENSEQQPPVIATEEEWQRLKPGEPYFLPNGQLMRKCP
jgi:hypothetical protein